VNIKERLLNLLFVTNIIIFNCIQIRSFKNVIFSKVWRKELKYFYTRYS